MTNAEHQSPRAPLHARLRGILTAMEEKPRLRRAVLMSCIVAALVRCTFQLVVAPPVHTAEDYNIARHLLAGEGFSYGEHGPTTIKGPFYPALLALFLALFGDPQGLQAVALFQHLLYAALPWLLFRIGSELGISRIGALAGLLFALHPSYVYNATVAENTAVLVFCGALWGLLLLRSRTAARPALKVLLMGALLGGFVLEKPVAVPVLIASLAALPRGRRHLLGFILIVAALVLLPWSIRGALLFGDPTPTRTYSAHLTFLHSWTPEFAVHPRYALSQEFAHRLDSLYRLPESAALPEMRRMALDIIRQHWKLWLERTLVHALVYWWVPPRYWGNFSVEFVAVRLLPVVLLNALTVLGFVRLWRLRRDFASLLLLALLCFTAGYALNHVVNIRYKLEVEWLQLYAAAAALEALLLRLHRAAYGASSGATAGSSSG
jgi:4-amino-4-deoxy-L-arabinose transferase-like glycosyltransferase